MAGTPQPDRGRWLPYAGLFLAIAGIIYQGGALTNQVAQQDARINKLEALTTSTTISMNELTVRGVKNEAKLDFLVQQAQDENERRVRR